jgi:hypothetical protein
VHLGADLTVVLPYLNEALQGAIYKVSVPALFWRANGHLCSFHAHEIAISDLEDREAAHDEVKRVVLRVN